jgi:hypothetical protein
MPGERDIALAVLRRSGESTPKAWAAGTAVRGIGCSRGIFQSPPLKLSAAAAGP